MTQRRLRQANLMGPSGYVSIDDSETMAMAQQGMGHAPEAAAVIELTATAGRRSWRTASQNWKFAPSTIITAR